MLKPTTIASTHVHDGRIISVSTERLRYANGREYDLDFIRHPGAAAVVPVDAANRVCLVRQYRHGVEDFLWEIPAGKLDPGESPAVCAVRELREETGIVAHRWTPLGSYVAAPGILNEIIHLYLARDLAVGAATPDVDEDLELQWIPFPLALERVLNGEWNDGKTIAALVRANHALQL
jgi:ADP-ribose pyrophosphatase